MIVDNLLVSVVNTVSIYVSEVERKISQWNFTLCFTGISIYRNAEIFPCDVIFCSLSLEKL